jgi:hypothetical protein
MPNDRDDEKPRIQIIDNRLLSDEERRGSGPLIEVPGQSQPSEESRPKLEIIGGNSPVGSSALHEEPGEAVSAPIAQGDAADATETVSTTQLDLDDDTPLSDEEMEQMRSQLEEEQFAQLEQEVGRPLTDAERTQVRTLMAQQAESMSRLEVAPLLLQAVSELPRYAAVHLGLIPNPYTGLIARNDAEARLAIDAFGALYETMKARIDPRAGAELARVLNDLRANYSRVTGTPIVPGGGGLGCGPAHHSLKSISHRGHREFTKRHRELSKLSLCLFVNSLCPLWLMLFVYS